MAQNASAFQKCRIYGYTTARYGRGLPGVICLVLLCVGFGAGCSIGPEYAGVQAPPLPQSYLNVAPAPVQHCPTPPLTWATMDDGYLGPLIARGIQNSPTIRELCWRIDEAAHAVRVVSGEAEPFADTVRNYEERKSSGNGTPFTQTNSDPFSFFSVGLNSRWEIDLVGRIRRETQAARHEYAGTVEDLADLRRILAADIAKAYVQLRLNQELLEQVRYICARQQASVSEVEMRIQAGQVTRLDLVQLRSRLELNRALAPQYEQRISQNYHALALLTGTTPIDVDSRILEPGSQLSPPDFFPELPANLLRRRPDIRRKERDVAAACERIGVAEAEFYPKLNILGTMSFNSRNVASLMNFDSLSYNIGPGVSWNILSLGRIESQVAIQKSLLQQAIAQYQQNVLEGVSEVEDALVAQSHQRQRIATLRKSLQDALESVDLSLEQYSAGLVSWQRVDSNQGRLINIGTELAIARADLATASINLLQALGGCDGAVQPRPHQFRWVTYPCRTALR